jgi:hypothetical protein
VDMYLFNYGLKVALNIHFTKKLYIRKERLDAGGTKWDSGQPLKEEKGE